MADELEAQGLRLVADHINRVQRYMTEAIAILAARSAMHDQSKYSPEEIGLVLGKPTFDKYEYMSEKERAAVASVEDALVHHYANNSHHPEHYKNGVWGMSLFDILEMAIDHKAASEVSLGGSYAESVRLNTKRFGYSRQLVEILLNTGREMGWLPVGEDDGWQKNSNS